MQTAKPPGGTGISGVPGSRPRWRRPGVGAELLDLVWPASCPGCGAVGAGAAPACPDCLAAFAASPMPRSPTPRPAWLPAVWAVADYDGSARAVLLAYKEHGRRRLGGPLGAALGSGLSAALAEAWSSGEAPGRLAPRPCVVVPMPSSAAARRTRGEDPTLRLTEIAVRRLRLAGVPAMVLPALAQRPGVADQAGLSAVDRVRNLSGALRLRPKTRRLLASAAVVLLADDIITTGATLAEATRVLSASDIAVCGAAVVAATARTVSCDPAAGGLGSTDGTSPQASLRSGRTGD